MKYYASEKRLTNDLEKEFFITDIQVVTDKEGNPITLAIFLDGSEWRPVPYTLENLNMFREIMREQGKQMQTLLPSKKRLLNKCRVGTIVGAAGIAGTIVLNSTAIGKEMGVLTGLLGGISGGVTLVNGIGEIVHSRAISYIQKVGIFVKHEDAINEYVSTNPYVYFNVSKTDRKKIEEWKKDECPITIERLDELSNKTIKTIWNNIKFYRHYGVTCGEPQKAEKQKTLRQV